MEVAERLRPYVAGLAVDWLQTAPNSRHRSVDGSLAFVDISGFTRLTERLASRGKVGAEELSDILDATFASLLEVAYSYGALLVKWGGDAVLLLFEGTEHAALACRAVCEMRARLRDVGRLRTSAGAVTLRMSVGVHSGSFDFFMAGRRHHELLIAGPAATLTAELETVAEAGEIVVSVQTAAELPARCVGAPKGDGFLLRSGPAVDPRCRFWPRLSEAFDFGSCLDPALREHLVAMDDDSEHRQIAIAFVEVTAVDDLLARQGPGVVANELHRLMVTVQEACARHHVTFWETDIARDGFKILLIAGAPRTTGHDEEGLLRTARAILDAHTGPISIRIGANCGRAFVGDFGPPFRRTFSVKADAVNLAARVMGKAAPGQLLATTTVLDRSRTRFDVEQLPPFLVKGKVHPVHAASVGAPREKAAARHAEVSFVGRQDELGALGEVLAAAVAGHGAAVALVGDAGSGKSRLLDEFISRLPAEAAVVRTECDDYESSTPYFPLRRLLRTVLLSNSDVADAVVLARLTEQLTLGAPDLLGWLPLIALPFGIELPDTDETAAVAEQFRPHRIAALVVQVLDLLISGAAVLVVEDAQFADEASVDVLGRVAEAASSRRWVLVAATRDGERAFATADNVRRVVLRPLAPDDSLALVRFAAGQRLTSRVAAAVVDRVEGNPLFALELVAAALTAPDAEELPGTLEEVLAAKVDELPVHARTLLRVASVLGSRFDDDLLAALIGEVPSDEQWASLDRFLVPDTSGSRRFRTRLVRDAAYEGLPFRRRQELHGRVADEVAQRAGQRGNDQDATLSLHYFAAHRFAQAWEYSCRAGDHARDLYANAEALTFYQRARLAARHLPDLAATELAQLLETIGDLHARVAELDRATVAYREARRRAPADAALLRARVAIDVALASTRAGLPARTMRWFSTAERDLDRATAGSPQRESDELRARITVERALIRFRQGRHREAAALCEQALRQGEAADASFVVARALHTLDINDLALGKPGDERRVFRALELFEQCGDRSRQAGMWNHLGIRAYYDGTWDVAVERYDQARTLHERAGDEWNAAIASANIAEILVDQGRLAEAEPLALDALRVWRASGTPSDIAFGAALLARLCGRSGRFAEAMVLLGEAVDAYSVSAERFDVLDTELRIVETLVLQGASTAAQQRLDDVGRSLGRALHAAGVAGAPSVADEALPMAAPQTTQLLRWRGYVAAQLGDHEAACTHLEMSLTAARTRDSAHDVALALDALDWLEQDAVRRTERDELFHRLGIVWTPMVPRQAVPTLAIVPQQRGASVTA